MPLQNGACTQPDPDNVRAELARICASSHFHKAHKLTAFLSLVVDLKLRGKDRNIKGYTIGTLALGRKKDFDPSTSAIVRVMAGRLRNALSSYYASTGLDDAIVIDIPVGTYVPVFHERLTVAVEPDEPDQSDNEPSLPPDPREGGALACEADESTSPRVIVPEAPAATIALATLPEAVPSVEVLNTSEPAARMLEGTALTRPLVSSVSVAVLDHPPPSTDTQALAANPPTVDPATLPPSPVDLPVPGGRAPMKSERRIGLRTMVITIGVFFAKVSLALAVISVSTGLDDGRTARTTRPAEYSTPLVVAVLDIEDPAARPDLRAMRVELRDTLIRALSLFEDVTVLAPTANTAAARFHIESQISEGPDPVLSVRFVRWPVGEVVWTNAVSVANAEARMSAVRMIATAIGRPGGLANKQVARWHLDGGSEWEQCRLATEEYFRESDRVHHTKAKACLDTIVARRDTTANEAAHAQMLSLLGRMHIEEYRHGFPSAVDSMSTALTMAQKAAEIAPESAWAWQTVCDAKFHNGNLVSAMQACERARKTNPFDTDIQALSGARLIVKGEHARGILELQQALHDNPIEPAWYKLWLFLGFWRAGEIDRAEACLRNLPGDLGAFGQIVLAIAAIEASRADEASQAIHRLTALRPEIVRAPGATLGRYFPEPGFAAAVLSALTRAGLSAG